MACSFPQVARVARFGIFDWFRGVYAPSIMPKPGRKTAIISSTSLDLPEHRREVEKACLREGVFPIGMEHFLARDADAIRVSLEIVNKANIYIGIFAWRYGHKPEGHDISITEMEFNRAIERKIPILVFLTKITRSPLRWLRRTRMRRRNSPN